MQEIAWRIVYPARPYAPICPRRCKVTPTYRKLPLVAGAHESERPARKVITLEQLTHYDTGIPLTLGGCFRRSDGARVRHFVLGRRANLTFLDRDHIISRTIYPENLHLIRIA